MPKRAEIAIGLPSYNEADNIGNVVQAVDLGLKKHFPKRKAVIINVDNNSNDNTKGVFLNTKTFAEKIYISTPKGIKGKGYNLKNFFKKSLSLDVKYAATIDTDLKSVNDKWIKCLIGSLEKGYDYIVPVYHRNRYGASITNRLCYPLVYGIFGYDMPQPIGGDMAFSRRMMSFWMSQKWPHEANKYGIDIFMTLGAIKSGYKIGQAGLGSKIHKPSEPKLDDMFLEVSKTYFWFLERNRELWQRKLRKKKLPIVLKTKKKPVIPRAAFCREGVEEKIMSEFRENYGDVKKFLPNYIRSYLEKELMNIKSDLWPEIVYHLVFLYLQGIKREKTLRLLRALYFARTISFIRSSRNKSQKETEKMIEEEAERFFEKRDYLLSLF